MQGIPQGQNSQGGSTGGSGGSQGGAQKPSLSWQSPSTPSMLNKPVVPATVGVGQKSSVIQPSKAKEKVSDDKAGKGAYVGVFVAGLIVGALIGSVISGQRGSSGSSTTASTTEQGGGTGTSALDTGSSLTGADVGAGDIEVVSPQSAGLSVAVSKINVSKPTWVVVYDNNAGVPGRSLGARLFWPASKGGETSGTIELLRPTVAGTMYLIGQMVDDGDTLLSFQKDTAVLGSDGTQSLSTLTAN